MPGLTGLVLSLLATAGAVETSFPVCANPEDIRNCDGPRDTGAFLSKYTHSSVYDRRSRPPCSNGTHAGATNVEVQLYLTQLNEVNTKHGRVSVTGYLRMWWFDPRLAFNGTDRGGCFDAISLTEEDARVVWRPDLYIDNLDSAGRDLAGTSLTEIYPSGRVWHSKHVTLIVTSIFDMGNLPYDSHKINVTVASYSKNIKQIRVFAKDGTPGPGVSGVGITTEGITNIEWDFADAGGAGGFQTPGEVEVEHSWDYLHVSWVLTRKSNFYNKLVLLPCTLFSLICYTQFFVDAAVVPARAALAVIPVLIMRTMHNSIYEGFPRGSGSMWLDDLITCTMLLTVGAAMQFGMVQFCRLREAQRSRNLQHLIKAKGAAEKLIGIATCKQIPLLHLLEEFAPEEKALTNEEAVSLHEAACKERFAVQQSKSGGDAGTPSRLGGALDEVMGSAEMLKNRVVKARASRWPGDDAEAVTMLMRSARAREEGVTEADLFFISDACAMCMRLDRNQSGWISVEELRQALPMYNIYLNIDDIVEILPKFLRDCGQPTPVDADLCHLSYSQFILLLIESDKYYVKHQRTSRYFLRRGLCGFCRLFSRFPPSERWDIGARYIFPLLFLLQVLFFWGAMGHY